MAVETVVGNEGFDDSGKLGVARGRAAGAGGSASNTNAATKVEPLRKNAVDKTMAMG